MLDLKKFTEFWVEICSIPMRDFTKDQLEKHKYCLDQMESAQEVLSFLGLPRIGGTHAMIYACTFLDDSKMKELNSKLKLKNFW